MNKNHLFRERFFQALRLRVKFSKNESCLQFFKLYSLTSINTFDSYVRARKLIQNDQSSKMNNGHTLEYFLIFFSILLEKAIPKA